MHIHLPKPLHGWREFVGEIVIIVIGVLIALGAEQLVEAWHWHHKIDAAEAAMRLELAEDDGPQAYGRVLIGNCLDRQLQRIQDGAGHVPAGELRQWAAAYEPPFRTWDSEAWKVVVAGDTGSRMGPERLLAWSSPYRSMPMLTEDSRLESQLAVALHQILPPQGEASREELQSLRRTAAQLRRLNSGFTVASKLLLARIARIGAPVPEATRRQLLAEARRLYGPCVTVPDLSLPPEAEALHANLTRRALE